MSEKKKKHAPKPKLEPVKAKAEAPKVEPATMFSGPNMPAKEMVAVTAQPSQFAPIEAPPAPGSPEHSYLDPKTISEACLRLSQEIDPNVRIAGSKEVAAMFFRLSELIKAIE